MTTSIQNNQYLGGGIYLRSAGARERPRTKKKRRALAPSPIVFWDRKTERKKDKEEYKPPHVSWSEEWGILMAIISEVSS